MKWKCVLQFSRRAMNVITWKQWVLWYYHPSLALLIRCDHEARSSYATPLPLLPQTSDYVAKASVMLSTIYLDFFIGNLRKKRCDPQLPEFTGTLNLAGRVIKNLKRTNIESKQRSMENCVMCTGLWPRRHQCVIAFRSTINNGNRTEWSPIRSVIIRVITKFVNHEYDHRPTSDNTKSLTN